MKNIEQIIKEYGITKDKREYILGQLFKLSEKYKLVFSDKVKELRERVELLKDPRESPMFIGEGSTTATYKLGVGALKYAVVLYGLHTITEENFNNELIIFYKKIIANIIANNVKNIPSVLAYSIKDKAIVMELALGEVVSKRIKRNIFDYSKRELLGLIKIISKLNEVGLCIDPYPENFFFDHKTGNFRIIDLCLIKKGERGSANDIKYIPEILANKDKDQKNIRDKIKNIVEKTISKSVTDVPF
ncbi:MAG: hypothetical protein ABH822_00775 [Patescibacteria group bacterium]